MTDAPLHFDADFSGLEPDDWLDRIEDLACDLGFFEPLGPDHQAVHLRAGTTLLVTFEEADAIARTPGAAPRSFTFAQQDGWSVLSVIARGESWFRHPAIYQFFDGLTDDGFFDGFDRVLFCGAGGAGYAAAAYSVAAPGARVLAIRPQATLAPEMAGWDTRYTAQRRLDFTGRYGFAPHMIEAALSCHVVYSPLQRADAMHAALFAAHGATVLRVQGLPGRLEENFDRMGVSEALIRSAMAGDLTRPGFARLMRAAKTFAPYQRSLFKRAVDAGHDQLAAQVAAHVLAAGDDSFFARKLDDLADAGIRPIRRRVVNAAE